VAAAVTAAGEAIAGSGELALFGGITSVVVTVAGFLSVDYLLSRADAAASQQELTLELRRVLDVERENLRRMWLAEAKQDIDARLAQVRERLPGETVDVPPTTTAPRP
jgi:hypothetical protein